MRFAYTANPMKKKSNQKAENKPTLIAFLLDRTGSMQDSKTETITAFNEYVKTLRKKETGGARFTLTQFDSQAIEIVHNAVPLKDVELLNEKTYVPRAWTPLHDAIGVTINATEKQAGTKFKVLFVTLTDGQENASKEYDLQKVNNLIKEMENKHAWTFAHIGIGPDAWAAVRSYAGGTQSISNALNIHRSDITATMRKAGLQSFNYMASTSNLSSPDVQFWSGNPKSKEDKAKK